MGSLTVITVFVLLVPRGLSRRYVYETKLLTWNEAQQNCRLHYTDLATFESMEDVDGLQRPPEVNSWAWIGLREDPQTWKQMGNATTSWRWSSTGQTSQSGYSCWWLSQPDNLQGETCVMIDGAGTWTDHDCDNTLPSICFNNSGGTITYVYNPTWLSWSDAQTYCRQYYVDLAMIESAEANAGVSAVVPAGYVAWMGLYRIPMAWSDQNPSTFRNWLPFQPDYLHTTELCGFETSEHLWGDADCNWTLESICYKTEQQTSKIIVRQTMSSVGDLTDPDVQQQIQQQLTEILSEKWPDVKVQLKIKPME